MGDGAKAGKGLILCTDSFSLQDVVRLMNVLIIKYNLKCSIWTIKPGSYRLHISAKSMDKVREIVKPYFIDSMLYKINL
jgi:hypothetical protein